MFFVIMMVMLMVMAAAGAVLIMLMVMMLMLLLQLCHLSSQSCLTFHGAEQLLSGQLPPGSGDDGSLSIVLPEHCYSSIQLCLRNGIGTGQDNGGSRFHLVVVKLAKVLHIDLDLACINHSNSIAQGYFLVGNLVHSADHIRQLADTGGLNHNPVRVVFRNDLGQCLAKVTHQRATDTSGVHLGNVDAGILQETAVNTDFAKFVFDQNQLLALVRFGNHFLDQGCLTGSQEAGIDIDFCHSSCTFQFYIHTHGICIFLLHRCDFKPHLRHT